MVAKSVRGVLGELFLMNLTGEALIHTFCFKHENKLCSCSNHLTYRRERPRRPQSCLALTFSAIKPIPVAHFHVSCHMRREISYFLKTHIIVDSITVEKIIPIKIIDLVEEKPYCQSYKVYVTFHAVEKLTLIITSSWDEEDILIFRMMHRTENRLKYLKTVPYVKFHEWS